MRQFRGGLVVAILRCRVRLIVVVCQSRVTNFYARDRGGLGLPANCPLILMHVIVAVFFVLRGDFVEVNIN